jgi:plasmid stabilization system protein ParE
MPRLIWSQSALQDVARLHAFLKPKNPDAARGPSRRSATASACWRRIRRPGRPAEDMPPGFRGRPIGFGNSFYVAL